MNNINQTIANEINAKSSQIEAAIKLLDEGATVPFIARYRKEATGGLSDTDLRTLEERLHYLRELSERRATILKSISEQEKLTPELEKAINNAETKTQLEDLYLPYKPKRRSKGQIAIEAGLEPLADALYANPDLVPETEAEKYLNGDHKIVDPKSALDGAKYILMERFCENAALLAQLRQYTWDQGTVASRCIEGKEKEGAKFRDYFEYNEALKKIPSHRALAIFRGRRTGILQLKIEVPTIEETSHCETLIAEQFDIKHQGRNADDWLKEVVRWTWRVKLSGQIETDLLNQIREAAEEESIQVFAKNLKNLLMAAPAGQRTTIGLDPGIRTGVKVAVVSDTGQLLDHTTIFPHEPKKQWDQSIETLYKLADQYKVDLISIGNGTASRETDKLVADMLKKHSDIALQKIVTNEAGASVYSASEYAAKEFPDLDVSFRGAVSIARRLQDPLAELVKIEPKSIGVGQYQHDVSQTKLARSLDSVVEDCVNAVGVDVNTASAPLLARISGLNGTIANNIIRYREKNGAFKNRQTLKEVPRLGERTFEQAAGFLRINQGDCALDNSGVHPESYGVVEKISAANQCPIESIINNKELISKINAQDYVDQQFGLPTITDILTELEKPGRDPRPSFKTAQFHDGIETIKDLKSGQILEGVITNVTNFGAFVDIGVHQDGLVHISVLSDNFVKNPADVVKTGDIVKVKVLEIDQARARISLSMKLDEATAPRQQEANPKSNRKSQPKPKNRSPNQGKNPAPAKSAIAAAFANAKTLKSK